MGSFTLKTVHSLAWFTAYSNERQPLQACAAPLLPSAKQLFLLPMPTSRTIYKTLVDSVAAKPRSTRG
jgi:hypothetical protein